MNAVTSILAQLPAGMDGFADIEGPVYSPWPLILLLGSLALLALLLAAAFWWFRRKRRTSAADSVPAVPPEPPLQVALRQLEELERQRDHYESDPLTVAASDIVRQYLKEVLHIPAREQTSEEFLAALRNQSNLPEVLHQLLPDFLRQCDRVKFARGDLDPSARDELLKAARRLLIETDQAAAPTAAPSTGQPAAHP